MAVQALVLAIKTPSAEEIPANTYICTNTCTKSIHANHPTVMLTIQQDTTWYFTLNKKTKQTKRTNS